MDDPLWWINYLMVWDHIVEYKPGMVYVWVDGACSGNPGPGGYAAFLWGWWQNARKERWLLWREDSGSELMATNNRMELEAASLGLELVTKESGVDIVLHSDSEYVVKAFTEGWLEHWLQNNGCKADGEAVKNWGEWLHLRKSVV